MQQELKQKSPSPRIIVYTFRSSPNLTAIQKCGFDPFIFHELKAGLNTLKTRISNEKPILVLGLAKGTNLIEALTINQFNKTKFVSKGSQDKFLLHIPKTISKSFKVNKRPSDSFCNWTAFKIAEFASVAHPELKVMFAHIKPDLVSSIIDLALTDISDTTNPK